MKSFFKKLSFVLAAAMIITLIPAQAAKAEGTIKLALQSAASSADAITYDTLKVGEKQDYKFYGCLDWQTTGLGWVSSNEAVATVDKSGVVTAVAAGVAQISYEAKGYTTEAITLLVADEYDVNIADQDSKEIFTSKTFTKIGDTQDFCFVGAKGYSLSTHKCTWFSTDANVAKVNNVGLVEAVGEGTAKIVLTIVDKATGAVAFSVAPLDVTVAVSKLEVKQTAYNAAEVTFGGEAAKDTITVFSVTKNSKGEDVYVTEYVKVDGKKITFYNGIENGTTYVVRLGEDGPETSFVGKVGVAKTFDITYYSNLKGKKHPMESISGEITVLEITNIKDEDGVLVDPTTFTYEIKDEDLTNKVVYNNYDGRILVAAPGEQHQVTIKLFDKKTGEETASNYTLLTGVAEPSITWKESTSTIKVGPVGHAYGDADVKAAKTTNPNFEISVDDYAEYGLALSIKDSFDKEFKFNAGEIYTDDTLLGDGETPMRDLGQFLFESSNYDVLGITDSGVLEARAQGTATVFIYFTYVSDELTYNKRLLATATVKVREPLVPTSIEVKANTNCYSTDNYARIADKPGACDFNTVDFIFTVIDQLGRPMTELEATAVELKNGSGVAYIDMNGSAETEVEPTEIVGKGQYKLTATANNSEVAKKSQSYTDNIRVSFTRNGKTLSKNVTVYMLDTDTVKKVEEPGVIMCRTTRDNEPKSVTGLGNTDNKSLGYQDPLYVYVHIVEVYAIDSRTFVYGNDVPNAILNYSDIKDVSKSADLAVQESDNEGAFYAAVYISENGKKFNLTDIEDTATAQVKLIDNNHNATLVRDTDGDGVADAVGQYLRIRVREAFENLSDGDAFEDALALSDINKVSVQVDVYDLYNTNSYNQAQNTSSWNKGVKRTYDDVATKEYLNNDVKNYNANIDIHDLTYDGDIPTDAWEWADWFAEHATLTANVWRTDANKGNASFEFMLGNDESVVALYNNGNNPSRRVLAGFQAETMTQNSKYIQNAGLFFELYNRGDVSIDGAGVMTVAPDTILTYIPVKIGKKVTPVNYQYKGESVVDDGEGGLRINQ